MFRTRTFIWLTTIVMAGLALRDGNLGAVYVAVVGGVIVYLLHTLEFKINKLLDRHAITVYDDEIGKD